MAKHRLDEGGKYDDGGHRNWPSWASVEELLRISVGFTGLCHGVLVLQSFSVA